MIIVIFQIRMDDNGEIAKEYTSKKLESLSATSNGLGANLNQNIPRQVDPRNREQPTQLLNNISIQQQQLQLPLPQSSGDLLTNHILSTLVQQIITPHQSLLNSANILHAAPQQNSDLSISSQAKPQNDACLEVFNVQNLSAQSLLPNALLTNLLLQAGNNLATPPIPDSQSFMQPFSNTTPNIQNNLTPPPPPPVSPPLAPPPPPKSRKSTHTDSKHKQNKIKQSQYLDKSSNSKDSNQKASKAQLLSSTKSRRHSESSPPSHASHERYRRAHSPSPKYSHSPSDRRRSNEKSRNRRREVNSRDSIRERDREKNEDDRDRYRRDSYSPHRYSNSLYRERENYPRNSHASYRTTSFRKSPPLSHASISAPKKSSLHNSHSDISKYTHHHASLKPRSSMRSSPVVNRSDVDCGIENISSDDDDVGTKLSSKHYDLNENKLVDITPVPPTSGVSDGDDMDISTDEDKPVIEKFIPEKKAKQTINGHSPPPPPPPPLPPNTAQQQQQTQLQVCCIE